MSLIATWTSGSASASSFTSTTLSAITLSAIFAAAAIAIGALIFLLALRILASTRISWNSHTAVALQAFYLPLFVTFCALVVVVTAGFL
jgi:hypothetical protein